jgi:ribosome biogenesis GTPase
MARRKGKSRNRVKDWQSQYHASDNFEHEADARKGFTRKEFHVPERKLSAGAEEVADLPRREGMVTGQFPGGAVVRCEGEDLLCAIAGTFRAPEGSSALTLGDTVTVAITRPEHRQGDVDIDKERADGVILQRGPRQTALCRPQPQGGKRRRSAEAGEFEKVIAANMDVLVIVSAVKRPAMRPGLIDRFLIIAERGELQPVLAVNKTDLAPPDPANLAHFEELGVEMIRCSAATGEGLDALRGRIAGGKSIFAGASGVGKSTLINALVPGANAATREVRLKDDRGRHTTTTASIYDLPGGGVIVDTPGLRELGLAVTPEELPWYFPEFEALGSECHFRDCTHTHEPGCRVLEAVEDGGIPRRRYRSYLNIRQTLVR